MGTGPANASSARQEKSKLQPIDIKILISRDKQNDSVFISFQIINTWQPHRNKTIQFITSYLKTLTCTTL